MNNRSLNLDKLILLCEPTQILVSPFYERRGQMQRSLKHSNRHFKNAIKHLPLGVSSNFRYWGEDKTIYVDHGKGGRITDIDGNEYVDYRTGRGYHQWRRVMARATVVRDAFFEPPRRQTPLAHW